MIGAAFAVMVLVVSLSHTSFIKTGMEAFSARFETANNTEGGTGREYFLTDI
jgi:hypothetical protein